MLKLEDVNPGVSLYGLEPSAIVNLAAVVPIEEGTVQVFFQTPDGNTKECLRGRAKKIA